MSGAAITYGTVDLPESSIHDLAANHNLDDTVEHHHVGTVNLRFIYLGMIAEVARHAGHADILAEQIQAAATKPSPDASEQRP